MYIYMHVLDFSQSFAVSGVQTLLPILLSCQVIYKYFHFIVDDAISNPINSYSKSTYLTNIQIDMCNERLIMLRIVCGRRSQVHVINSQVRALLNMELRVSDELASHYDRLSSTSLSLEKDENVM